MYSKLVAERAPAVARHVSNGRKTTVGKYSRWLEAVVECDSVRELQ